MIEPGAARGEAIFSSTSSAWLRTLSDAGQGGTRFALWVALSR
jgi:hypothetical protein